MMWTDSVPFFQRGASSALAYYSLLCQFAPNRSAVRLRELVALLSLWLSRKKLVSRVVGSTGEQQISLRLASSTPKNLRYCVVLPPGPPS